MPTSYTVSLSVTNAAKEVSTTTLLISVNDTPPGVTITSPVDGSQYSMASNTICNLTANVVDNESPDAQLQYQWELFLHHDNHEHPNPVDTNHVTSVLITPIGCDGINIYYYRIQLTVTDPQGLSTTRSVSLFPDCGAPDLPAEFRASRSNHLCKSIDRPDPVYDRRRGNRSGLSPVKYDPFCSTLVSEGTFFWGAAGPIAR